MIRITPSFSTLAFVIGIAAVPAAAQQYPAEPGSGVADMAGVLTPTAADSIRVILNGLRADPGVEVRVLTVQNIARYQTGDATPEAFATAVYNDWKLGYGQRQDGVLVMVSVDDRFARIELGDGVPALQDLRMQRIMDERMVPRFRQGSYSGGVLDGVLAIAESFRDSTAYAAVPQPVGGFSDPQTAYGTGGYDPAYSEPGSGGNDEGAIAALLGLMGLGAAGAGGAWYLRNRKRNCAECGLPMQKLGETGDDVFLDSGRRLEEVLGSVDYDVWQCTGCSHHTVRPYPTLFSGKKDCPSCGYKTVIVTTTVLERATYDRSGRQRVEKDCRHCSWHDEDVVTLPRLERSSDSSSSSSESFSSSGGGSSGGGWSGGGGGGGSSGGSSSGRGASGRW